MADDFDSFMASQPQDVRDAVDRRFRELRAEYAATTPSLVPDRPSYADYRRIAHLIGSIFYAGNFKAETPNEVELEAMLVKTGHRYASWEEIDAAAPPAEAPAERGDDFEGDNAHLIECIDALVSLNDSGALVPHGIGGHARKLLLAAASRLAATPAGEVALNAEYTRGRNDGWEAAKAAPAAPATPVAYVSFDEGDIDIDWLAPCSNGYLYAAPVTAEPAEGVTMERLAKHELPAGECPPQSRVVLLSSLHRMLAETTPRGPGGRESEADMFWDHDDNERCYDSIIELVTSRYDYDGIVGSVLRVQRAMKLPDLLVRITEKPETETSDAETEYEVVVDPAPRWKPNEDRAAIALQAATGGASDA